LKKSKTKLAWLLCRNGRLIEEIESKAKQSNGAMKEHILQRGSAASASEMGW
jgi:hypothetical protein